MKILLREIEENDAELIVKWRNSDKIRKHCFSKAKISVESHMSFFRENVLTGKYKQFIVEIIDEQYGVCSYPIASIALKDFDSENHRCELCMFTSDDEEWNNDSQRMALEEMLKIAFVEYGIHKIYTYVFSEFEEEGKLFVQAGFEEEALLKKEALNIDGQYVDVIRYAIYR